MWNLVLGSLIISILHGLLPNHWLPIVTVGKNRNWGNTKILQVTGIAATAHSTSTIILGIIIAFIGRKLSESMESFTHIVAPTVLIIIGIWFLFQHYKHNHFHLHGERAIKKRQSEWTLIIALTSAMFFSPCLEIEGIYLQAGAIGWETVLYVSIIYLIFSILGMILWVYLSLKGVDKFNWHRIEHNSGIISGLVLIALGIVFYFIH